MLRVAVICESSRRVASAFERLGHYAVSCDLKPAEQPGNHIQGNAREQDWSGFDLIICHPDCTYLCNSGARWLFEDCAKTTKAERWIKMKEAVMFLKWCLDLPCEHIAVENPLHHKWAKEELNIHYSQIIHPYYFGEMESKATCLWLKGLPPLMFKCSGGEGIKHSVHKMPPGANQAANRSRTFNSVAEAMASQWSSYILEEGKC
jgi:hypothetical protein